MHSLKKRNEEPTGKQDSKQGRTLFLKVGVERESSDSTGRCRKGSVESNRTENARRGNNRNAVSFRDSIVRLRNLVGMQNLNVEYVDVRQRGGTRERWFWLRPRSFRLGEIPSRLDQGRQRAELFGALEEGVLLYAPSAP